MRTLIPMMSLLAALCLLPAKPASAADAGSATAADSEPTETQVIAAMGLPTSATMHNGIRMFVYAAAQAAARPATFNAYATRLVGADVTGVTVVLRFGLDHKLMTAVVSQ